MENNSDTPITVSEIPPQKQLSPLSFFARLAGQSSSKKEKTSQDSSKEISSSPSKSFVQTPLDSWIERSSRKRSESPEESLPPWATPRTVEQEQTDRQNLSFSIDSLPLEVEEEDSFPIPEYETEANQQDRDDFSILDSQDIIGPPDYPEDESEPYCTPHPHSSPEANLPEPVPKESSPFFDNHSNTGRRQHSDNDSQTTAPYNYNDSPSAESNDSEYFQATSPYNSNDSQLTVPYNFNDITQTTTTYDRSYDSLDIPVYNIGESSPVISTHNPTDSQSTAPYDYNDNTQSSIRYDPSYDSQEIPPYNKTESSPVSVHDPNDSQLTIPYNYDDNTQLIVPFDPNYDSQEIPSYNIAENSQIIIAHNTNQSLINVPYFSENSQLSCGPSNVDSQIPAPYTPINNYLPDIVSSANNSKHNTPPSNSPYRHSSFDDDDLAAAISSPSYPDELFQLLIEQTEETKTEFEFEKNLKRNASVTNEKRDTQEDSTRFVNSASPMKQQKLNINLSDSSLVEDDRFSSNDNYNKSQESVSAQQRSSVLKKPVPIENYFLGSSFGATSQDDSHSDIGRASITPSFRYNDNDDIKKENLKKDEKQTSVISVDRRRRPRLGLSRTVSK